MEIVLYKERITSGKRSLPKMAVFAETLAMFRPCKGLPSARLVTSAHEAPTSLLRDGLLAAFGLGG